MSNDGREIERKYLIAMPDRAALASQRGCVIWRVTQTYLAAPEGETRRVRRIVTDDGEHFTRTFKRRIDFMSCMEDEAEISREEYEALIAEADPERRPIIKVRYRIPYMGQLLEVDIYPFWTDRAVLEIELPDEQARTDIPAWIRVLREVTGERAYSNAELAREAAGGRVRS
ncbi:MAG: hypothetical protein E7317_02180 [Clostridiales bacterium]|nr:hypothetical protein [Clostridiales bacterium]